MLLVTGCAVRAASETAPSRFSAANFTAAPSNARVPVAWDGPDQVTPPLPIVRTSAPPIVYTRAVRSEAALPVSLAGARLVASGGGTLYFAPDRASISAVDAVTGAVRWHAGHLSSDIASASDALLFVNSEYTSNGQPKRPSTSALALAADSGRRVDAQPGYWAGTTLHGYYYAYHSSIGGADSFAAYDATTGRKIWSNAGSASVGGPPTLVGATLLQSFSESGAILVNAMHAFDVVTGRELWRQGHGPRPLGTGPGVVYLDTTWFPLQLDNYVPLGVGTVDLATGSLLHEYYYKPDRARNWPRRDNTPFGATGTHVGGGFVTFKINGAWYRYDADRDPNDAHAVRLDGIDDVVAWFADTRALVTANGGAALARLLPDRIELQPLGSGALRAPVALADDGTRYGVVGTRLLALDSDGLRVRALGAVACDAVTDVIVLRSRVVVRCGPQRDGAGERLVAFSDPAAPVAAGFPHPRPSAPARFTLSVTQQPVPPAGPSAFDRQWWPSSIAAGPNGPLAIVLTPGGATDRAGAIGRVTASGAVDVVRIPERDGPPQPRDVVVDGHGTIWFNDDRSATVTSLRPDGIMRTLQIGAIPDSTPPPRVVVMGGRSIRMYPRSRQLGIRLAVGPDGEAWYARSHPTRTIGRVDGSRAFPVADAVGDVVSLVGGRDGALWFLTADAVGRVTRDGTFARVPLPNAFNEVGYPARRIVAGRANTVWVTAGKRLAEVDARRVLRTWSLPNASSSIAGLTVGCDGTVYAADTLGTQLARFAPDGSLEEHESGLFTIDGLATASDCRLWYVGGSNAPTQEVGTFTFEPV